VDVHRRFLTRFVFGAKRRWKGAQARAISPGARERRKMGREGRLLLRPNVNVRAAAFARSSIGRWLGFADLRTTDLGSFCSPRCPLHEDLETLRRHTVYAPVASEVAFRAREVRTFSIRPTQMETLCGLGLQGKVPVVLPSKILHADYFEHSRGCDTCRILRRDNRADPARPAVERCCRGGSTIKFAGPTHIWGRRTSRCVRHDLPDVWF